MDLDVHKLELERQRLKELIDENARNWQSVVDEMTRQARREGGALAGLPTRPTSHADQLDRWSLTILDAGEWVNVDQVLTALRARIATRSEEHTSELQSLMRTSYAVFCLKKKIQITIQNSTN